MTEIQHLPEQRLFRIDLDGDAAYVYYEIEADGAFNIRSTFVPPRHRGQGLGAALIEAAVAWAGDQGREVRTTCWYATRLLAS